ncbi:conserved hypothetical protein [Rhodospirillaceae bacterium LM-1]|nr:conserved hypothetical protein [Rhodospirillaceae bacterium LM-1]
MSLQSDLHAAVAQVTADGTKLHQIVHGDALSTVTTEGGLVKTLAKAIADSEANIAASRAELDQKLADAAESASTAAGFADAAGTSASDAAAHAAKIPDPAFANAHMSVRVNGAGTAYEFALGGGDVAGPASATDNDLVRFDGASGKLLKSGGKIQAADIASGVLGTAAALDAASGGTGGLLRADGNGSGLTGIIIADQTARDQIAASNLRLLLATNVSSGALIQGYQWEFASDEWGASSANETLATTDPALVSGTVGTVYGTVGGGAYCFDGDISTTNSPWSGSNGKTLGKVWATGKRISTIRLKTKSALSICGNNGSSFQATVYGIPVGGGTPVQLGDTGVASLPALSSYDITGLDNGTVYGTHYILWSNLGNAELSLSEMEFYEIQFPTPGYYYNSGGVNMTLLPPSPVAIPSPPSYMVAYFLWKDDSGNAVLGTDLTVELSRNNGAEWGVATDLTNIAGFDGSYLIVKARANVSAQPSGAEMKVRINTLNGKVQRIAAPALYAE